MNSLAGKRVLVVEDEAMIAAMICDWLEGFGCLVVGPAARLAEGLSIAQEGLPDVAVLDVNLNGEPAYPLADHLRGEGVPVVLATGYGEGAAQAGHGGPVLEKPFSAEQLAAALATALELGKAG